MTIYLYSLPAAMALVAGFLLWMLSIRSQLKTPQTRIFRLAVMALMGMNLAELAVLQLLHVYDIRFFALAYYVAGIATLALLVQLAMSISFDKWSTTRYLPGYSLLYGSFLFLELGLLFFTPLLIEGFGEFRGYTISTLGGPLYGLIELYAIGGATALVLIPLFGLRRGRSALLRNQCKLWLAAATPTAVLIISVMILRHYQVQWINPFVTLPLLTTVLLLTAGYVVHNRRIIELDFFIPWSTTRRRKRALYEKLYELSEQLPRIRSPQVLIDRLAETLECPVNLVGQEYRMLASTPTQSDEAFSPLPFRHLYTLEHMVVVDEIKETLPDLYRALQEHRIAVVIPFFPYSQRASHWLVLREPFSHRIYTQTDFRMIQRLFARIAGVVLDALLIEDAARSAARPGARSVVAVDRRVYRPTLPHPSIHKPLEECLAEYEAELIQQALISCHGNQADAARLLGVRRNTLHYKLKRYGLRGAR